MRQKPLRLVKDGIGWLRRLPLAGRWLFAARTPRGRALKQLLFAAGVILPLGSLIWMLLFWHGKCVGGASPMDSPAAL